MAQDAFLFYLASYCTIQSFGINPGDHLLIVDNISAISFYLHNQKTALNGVNQAFPWCAPREFE